MEDNSQLANLDNETLIESATNPVLISSPSPSRSNRHWIFELIAVRIVPIIIFILSIQIFKSIPTFKITIVTLSIFVEFWLVKNKEGLELVGLRWSHEISESGGKPHYVFYSRPDPFIPDVVKLRCFWSFMYFIAVFWGLISILTLIPNSDKLTWVDTFLAFMSTALQMINLICFLNCNKQYSRQADDIARSVMLGDAFDSDNLEPEPEIDQEQPEIPQVTPEPHEKKKRELENPRLTLPVKPKSSTQKEENKETKQENIENDVDTTNQIETNDDKEIE